MYCLKFLLESAYCFVLLFALIVSSTLSLAAQAKRGAGVKPTVNTDEKRLALVFGTVSYVKTDPLKNPVNDATDMTVALKSLGLSSGTNQSKKVISGAFYFF